MTNMIIIEPHVEQVLDLCVVVNFEMKIGYFS